MPQGRKNAYGKPKPQLKLPKLGSRSSSYSPSSSPISTSNPPTPKTPADEGIDFFQSQVIPGESPIRVYQLRLDPDGGPNKSGSYIRLPPAYTPFVLRVSLDAGTPASKNGIFKTNFPLDGGAFSRDQFAERRLPTNFSKPIHVDLPISHAGAFMYWIEYEGDEGKRVKGRIGYFNVDPVLRSKARTPILDESLEVLPASEGGIVRDSYVNLPLDGLSVLTVVSKWMGPINNWREHLQEATLRGYTMLHYPPLQERGFSDSPYSIKDQKRYDHRLFGHDSNDKQNKKNMKEILQVAKEEYGLLSLTDVVLNHTASDSAWLHEHPEAGYSPSNTPHLTPALDLDTAILRFSGSLASKNLPTTIKSEEDLNSVISAFGAVIRGLNLWQFYVFDVARERDSVGTALNLNENMTWVGPELAGRSWSELADILRLHGKIKGIGELASRFGVSVDGNIAAGFIRAALPGVSDIKTLVDSWAHVVDAINEPLYREWEEDIRVALDNIRNRAKYIRLDKNGPNFGDITEQCPLVEPYFTRVSDTDTAVYSLANNGWIWDADPLQNFALLPSKAYLRREVIVWGDCVKLRYGKAPEENPWLWNYMAEYVTSLARLFDGFRIDNCHSTPLEVGKRMLDAARVAKPDLYVCAELFTGSEDMDLVFVRELGINSLIRECGNAWDPKELSRLLYRYGIGNPIGSMEDACMTTVEEIHSPTGRGPIRNCLVTPLNGSVPHALLYDQTHDNESTCDRRSAEDTLSTGALVTFSFSAIGSVKGFDDVYPKLLNLVNETRQYQLTGIGENSGIGKIKRVLNHLHLEMTLGDYKEGHVHQENDYIVLHRVHPATQRGYLLVAHTAFKKNSKERGYIEPIRLRRTRSRFILGAILQVDSYEPKKDDKELSGLPTKLISTSAVAISQGQDHEGPFTEITPPEYFPPGSILLFETQLENYDFELDALCANGAQEAFEGLNLVDLNCVLYRSESEERDVTGGKYGAYEVPGAGKLAYCGLEGWMHPLRHIMRYNDLGHPLSAHLRQGTWALDYIHERLSAQTAVFPAIAKVAEWLQKRFERVKAAMPNFLRPRFFALIVSTAYKAARRAVIEQSSDFILSGHDFTQNLAMCGIQMHGVVKSASLDPSQSTPSLAAGLPHFSTGWARCWGRDVFISLGGLFLTTGNYSAAKQHILAFASTLKHGLIPNLLDSVRNPRYNSRDSPWWMLQNIQDYVLRAPDGLSILQEVVKRRFPRDDTWVSWDDPRAYSYSCTLAEIIQEILQRHADGIHFREYNAGPNLDMQMKDEGFNIDIRVDWTTGFISGGNGYNCGTWMDKMGESQKAGTKGIPATPRDGAPVEITGLLKSTLRWLGHLSKGGQFPFNAVQANIDGERQIVTYDEWAARIQASFEKCYYVPTDPSVDDQYNIDVQLVNRRGIYKDVYGSSSGREWADYQLRSNFPIAMAVAPELFDEKHALYALEVADKVLRGPLGMKTLDPQDLQYRPIYDNSNDTADASIAKGWNYHNGPEWGWPLGYFLRSYLYFDSRVGSGKHDINQTLHNLHRILLVPRRHIQEDPWAGLPELTNVDGQYCADSCPTQAWSASTLLEFLEAVQLISSTCVES
ncbi:glycoside hydrolase family 133 protein [Amanita muscaria Koide BX008]|uniref:Glycogen debranching enzyme n=1 Tax=Amanita muscaria (strain Koide BX008) TaxID=946122 RepID=A0A0C2X5E2_AMAMK|nr:glycoside hydrolase family 133 protein [Amanita muscaria Koide BX008]